MGDLSFPELGDETLALRLEYDYPFSSVTADVVLVRHGSYLLFVIQLGRTVDTDETQIIVEAAEKRL
jgi:hypothetical protein